MKGDYKGSWQSGHDTYPNDQHRTWMELCKTCHTLSQGQTTVILDPLLFIESQALSVAKKLKDLKTIFQDFVCLFEVKHLRHH